MERLPVIAVVDRKERHAIVWHVNMEVRSAMPARLVGAWVLDPDEDSVLKLLVAERYVWATGSGSDHLRYSAVEVDASADADLMVEHVLQYQNYIFGLFETHKANDPVNRRNLVRPQFLRPEPFPVHIDAYGPRPVDSALTAARWFASMADLWADTDAQRTSREYMRQAFDHGPLAFPLPQALSLSL